jgi:RimJ/RimL family protein N-acetyltransferase
MILTTDRLVLRRWRDGDRAAFARLCADPRVMEFFPALLSRAESEEAVSRIEQHFERHNFGLCATELRADGSFIGFIGIWVPEFEAAFTPCVEIGWRLAADYWGRGLATEGARAITAYAFEILKLPELVSFTTPANARSRRVMEKLGMTRNADEDFDHPRMPAEHPMRRHVLYRLRNTLYDRTDTETGTETSTVVSSTAASPTLLS